MGRPTVARMLAFAAGIAFGLAAQRQATARLLLGTQEAPASSILVDDLLAKLKANDSASLNGFTYLDLMVLVAATALSLAAIRYYVTTPWELRPTFDNKLGTASFITLARPVTRGGLATIGSLWLAVLSPALLWVWSRPPRASFLTMILRPGVSAATVATIVVVAFLGWHLSEGWPTVEIPAMGLNRQTVVGRLDLVPTFVLDGLKRAVGPAVAATWTALVVSGRWRVSADWIDRSGLALGIGWFLVCVESLI